MTCHWVPLVRSMAIGALVAPALAACAAGEIQSASTLAPISADASTSTGPDASGSQGGGDASGIQEGDAGSMNHGADAAASPLPDGAVVVPADAAPPTPTDASAPDAADGGGDAGASVDASDGGAAVPGNDSGATNDAGKGADSGGSADAGPTSCVAPLTDCNGSCVNEQTDNSNCGGCGAACGVATASCVSGICETWLTQQAWTESSSSANATISHQTDGGHVAEQFRYNDTSTDAYSGQSFTWRATASTSTTVNYAWSYSGFHAYYLAAAGLQAYADGPSGTSTVTLVPTSTVSGNFAFNGTSSLSVTSGYAFGFIASGINDDSTDVLQGEVTITPQ